jgi:signal transduction histidine kinase
LLVFGVAFVLALNVGARIDRPQTYEGFVTVERAGPGQAVTVPVRVTDLENEVYNANLERLQKVSLAAIVGLAIASGVGGYVLSGMLLRPIRDITDVASQIGATNLSRRIKHEGPDDELKALADTFDSMIGRIEESFEHQRQFVQDASHELRTPLAAMRTNIEVTELDETPTIEEYHELMQTLKMQTERLTRLSDDLLLLTTTGREAPDSEPIEIPAIAAEVVRQLSQLAATRDVTITLETVDSLEAMGAGDLVYRCVFNLVDNAIKYGGDGGRVAIRAWRDNGMARIDVSDNGPGMAPEDAARVFDRFYRIDKGRSRRQGGSGLGLAIVRELVQNMGGQVAVNSSPGTGATFTILLPLVPEDEWPDQESRMPSQRPVFDSGRDWARPQRD